MYILTDNIVLQVLQQHLKSLQDCLALGAIFATTDSVAVIQVLEEDRAPLLFSLVFGEGVINDATSVALLRTVQVGSASSDFAACMLAFALAELIKTGCYL